MDVFLARHAIFDRNLSLFGYELLFRSCDVKDAATVTDDSTSTLEVLSNTLLSAGLRAISGGAPLFINFGQELLTSEWTSLFPPEAVVIEILESVQPDPAVITACLNLKEKGYLLALDDVIEEHVSGQLAQLANFVKVDFQATTREQQLEMAKIFRARGKRLLAEKVETHDQFQWAREAGYDYFQGFFFARPMLWKGQQLPTLKITALRLLRESQRPEIDFPRLENIVKCDISLTYKLLRYVNSALFARSKPVSSIRDALISMGELDVRRWIALITLKDLAAGVTQELVAHALVRARFCEMLAATADPRSSNDAFLVGMFSLLDALVDRPLPEILKELSLPDSVLKPLLGTDFGSTTATVYKIALHYEAAEWSSLATLVKSLKLPDQMVLDLYLEAIAWSVKMLDMTSSEAPGQRRTAKRSASSDFLALQKAVSGKNLADSNQVVEQIETVTMERRNSR